MSKHKKEKPISHFTFPDYCVDDFFVDETKPQAKEVCPHSRAQDYHQSIKKNKKRQKYKQKKPEPQKDVDLLVDYIDGKDAEGVVFFEFSRSTELDEAALGHAREHEDHGIDAYFLIVFHEPDHVQTKRKECSSQEPVDQEHLPWNEGNKAELI